jgi:hypothetical protein
VFWVHASNAARFEQSYRDIADTVKIFGRQNPKANIFKLVHDWLHEGKRGEWVLILDNVDDSHFLLNIDTQGKASSPGSTDLRPLRDYLPQSQNGSILITSRSKEAAFKLVEKSDIIEVEPMDGAHAVALFKKKLGKPNSRDVAELVEALEYMPLAIVQAAAYISQRAPRFSVTQYLQDFRKSDRKRTGLLSYEGGGLHRDREAKNSIIITWQISFNYIQQTRPSAADLLSLMSFFDPQGIPESLLHHRPEEYSQQDQSEDDIDEDSLSQSSTSNKFEDDVLKLRNYSFISVNPDGQGFEMHSLVQLAMRTWLEANGQLERWKQQFIRNLCKEFPNGEYETWVRCQALFPHAESAAEQQPKEASYLAEWATLLYYAARYSCKKGNYKNAEKLAAKSVKARIELFGRDHEDTLNSIEILGTAYDLEGEKEKAAEVRLEVMETRKSMLGEAHPDTLTSMGNLALTFWRQGRWKEAEELGVQVMETIKSVLGEAHPGTLTSMANLALTFWRQGRLKEAEELQVKELEMCKSVLGEAHPDTLTSMANLASTYRNQGRWKEAEELQAKELEMCKGVLGEAHPDTLISMANLALTFWNQGLWKEAEELEVQVIKTRKRVLGEAHPDTLTSMSNLAATFRNQGRWKEAEELEVQVMETRKSVLGEAHPDTLTSMHNLAFTFKGQGRDQEALALMEKCIKMRKQVLGLDHPFTTSLQAALNEWQMGDSDSNSPNPHEQ